MTTPGMEPPRDSPLERIANLRDLTAQKTTADGRGLRAGRLFRSARLDGSTPNDTRVLFDALRIRTIVDLRSSFEIDREAESADSKWYRSQVRYADATEPAPGLSDRPVAFRVDFYQNFFRSAIWTADWLTRLRLLGLLATGYRRRAVQLLCERVIAPGGLAGMMLGFLHANKSEVRLAVSLLARGLAADPDSAVLFHCSMGKDRTGLVAALVLAALGVPRDQITRDYEATAAGLASCHAQIVAEFGSLGLSSEFADCPAVVLERVFEDVDSAYGGPVAYLTRECLVPSSDLDIFSAALVGR